MESPKIRLNFLNVLISLTKIYKFDITLQKDSQAALLVTSCKDLWLGVMAKGVRYCLLLRFEKILLLALYFTIDYGPLLAALASFGK